MTCTVRNALIPGGGIGTEVPGATFEVRAEGVAPTGGLGTAFATARRPRELLARVGAHRTI